MKIFENKTICIIIMIVLIIAGFLIGGYKGLHGQYSKVSDAFFLGAERDGACIANDMAERQTALINMMTIGRNYLTADNAALTDSASSIKTFEEASSIKDMFAANRMMDTAMEGLYRELGKSSIAEKDEVYRQRLYANFNSSNDRISHDPYYSAAAAYNETVSKFPANLIIALTPATGAVQAY